jgi:hypothetical protein
MSRNSQFVGIAVWTLVGAATVTGVVAYRTVYARPGAEALFMMPKSAIVVGVLDLNPSPNQTLVYKRIEDALSRNSVTKSLDEMSLDLPIWAKSDADLFRPYVDRGLAFGLLETKDAKIAEKQAAVLLLPVKDPVAVSNLLKRKGKPAFWRGTQYYQLSDKSIGYRVVADRLVVGQQGWAIEQVAKAASGEAPRLVDQAGFQAARGRMAAEANLVVMVSPDAMDEGDSEPLTNDWLAFGATIRDNGFEILADVMLAPGKDGSMARLGKIDSLRPDLLRALPANPLALVAVSSPGGMAEVGMDEGKKAGVELNESDEVKEELGVSVNDDILPALKGTSVIGVYPSKDGESMDFLVLSDSDHGAKPAVVAQKAADKVNDETIKESGKPFFVKETTSDVVITRLSDEQQDEVEDSLGDLGDQVGIRKLFKDKTLIMATVGDAAIIGSSREMIDRALASYRAKTAEATGSTVSGTQRELASGTQLLMTFSVSEITRMVRRLTDVSKMDKDGKETFDRVTNRLQDLTDPFMATAAVKSDGHATMPFMIPMDWELMIDEASKKRTTPPVSAK